MKVEDIGGNRYRVTGPYGMTDVIEENDGSFEPTFGTMASKSSEWISEAVEAVEDYTSDNPQKTISAYASGGDA